MVSAVLVLSLGTVLGIKSYNSINLTSLMGANLEALTFGDTVRYPTYNEGTCGFVSLYNSYGYREIMCGISYQTLCYMVGDNKEDADNWCCDSCASTWYCGS